MKEDRQTVFGKSEKHEATWERLEENLKMRWKKR